MIRTATYLAAYLDFKYFNILILPPAEAKRKL